MAEEKRDEKQQRKPRGFTPRSGGMTSEYAREQGWDTNEEQRAQTPSEKQPYDGGRDYDYGARDFGDSAVDTSGAEPAEMAGKSAEGRPKG